MQTENNIITLSCVTSPLSFSLGDHRYYLNGLLLTYEDLQQSLEITSHSPTGFNHGYNGSGPAQLALCVCLKLFGRAGEIVYKDFKHNHLIQAGNGDQKRSFMDEIDISEYKKKIEDKSVVIDLSGCSDWEQKVTLIETHLEEKFGRVFIGKKGELAKTEYKYIELDYIREYPGEVGQKIYALIESIKVAEEALIMQH